MTILKQYLLTTNLNKKNCKFVRINFEQKPQFINRKRYR